MSIFQHVEILEQLSEMVQALLNKQVYKRDHLR